MLKLHPSIDNGFRLPVGALPGGTAECKCATNPGTVRIAPDGAQSCLALHQMLGSPRCDLRQIAVSAATT